MVRSLLQMNPLIGQPRLSWLLHECDRGPPLFLRLAFHMLRRQPSLSMLVPLDHLLQANAKVSFLRRNPSPEEVVTIKSGLALERANHVVQEDLVVHEMAIKVGSTHDANGDDTLKVDSHIESGQEGDISIVEDYQVVHKEVEAIGDDQVVLERQEGVGTYELIGGAAVPVTPTQILDSLQGKPFAKPPLNHMKNASDQIPDQSHLDLSLDCSNQDFFIDLFDTTDPTSSKPNGNSTYSDQKGKEKTAQKGGEAKISKNKKRNKNHKNVEVETHHKKPSRGASKDV
ncbi:hypothetical protein QJS10_CPA07g00351 [Acorus calamus]|uniref:Uncharacterized protein n=1 Tax=Acorus calamus TaxID=4465 RepID=A0AAV9EGU8_ACOCL|nr:hypothetical protein QJS10_CPA07g00351 [Acorus calamus]